MEDKSRSVQRVGGMPLSGWRGTTSAARILALMALLVLVCGTIIVLWSGTSPSPGLPPYLVRGEDATAGWGISRRLPVILGVAGALGILGLTVARRPINTGRWLAVLATTWALSWLAWNLLPDHASIIISILLLLLNGLAIGAWWRIFRRRGRSGAPPDGRSDGLPRRAGGLVSGRRQRVLGAVVLLLLAMALAAPAIAQRLAVQPRGTLATIAVATPPEVDDGMIVSDARNGRTILLLRTNYLVFDSRFLQGTVITLDSRRGTIVGTISLDLYPGTLAVDSRVGHGFINAVAEFSSDLALNTLHVLDLRSGKVTHVLSPGSYLDDIAMDERTNHLFAADADENSVHMLDARTGVVLRTTAVGWDPEQVVVASGAGRVFVINDGDDTHVASMSILDATSGALLRTSPSDAAQYYFTFAVDDRTNRVFAASGGVVRVWDARSGAALRQTAIPGGGISALAVSAGTNRVFAVNSDHHSVSTLDARSGRLLRTIPVGSQPSALAVDDHMRRVFIANSGSNSVSALDATTGRVLDTLPTDVTPIAIAVDARLGRAFVYNAGSETVSIIQTGLNRRGSRSSW